MKQKIIRFGLLSLLFMMPLMASAETLTLGQLCRTFVGIKNLLFGVIGTLAVLSILYAAFLFLTGGGNEETQKKAKTFLLYGIIGIAVALFANIAAPSIAQFLGISGTDLTSNCRAF